MAFCLNCGTKLEEGTKFCMECGKSINTGNQNDVIPTQNAAQTNNPAKNANDIKSAYFSLVFGLIGLIAWVFPVGIIVGLGGLICGIKGRNTAKKDLATIGLILSIICLVVTMVVLIIGLFRGELLFV